MSVPYAGREFTFHNPDGSQIQVRGWGDQSAAVFETLDGYTVVKDAVSGFYHYAALSSDGQALVAGGTAVGTAATAVPRGLARKLRLPGPPTRAAAPGVLGGQRRWEARREAKRARLQALQSLPQVNAPQRNAPLPGAPAALPSTGVVGSYVGLCLLVQFPDVPGTISQAEVDDFCNLPGYTGFGNNGSVHDYFESVSDGQLHYTNRVAAYCTAQHPRSHYTDPGIAYGVRAQELVTEALDALAAGGFDFSALSSDDAGFVRALNIFYAGSGVNAWAEGLWPHSSALNNPYAAAPGKTFSDYQITDMGEALTLGTFCHENGHMICDFPDLYDTDSEVAGLGFGVGRYCLMCYGCTGTNPTQVGAYLKHAAGWASKTTTLAPGTTASVAAGVNDFLLHARSASEYFILENRQQAGRDASLPDAGLAIWHVDRLGNNNLQQMTPSLHYECSLVQADNRFDLEQRMDTGDSTDLYGAPSALAFGADTAPHSLWWDGEPSGLEITQISAPGASMSLAVGYPGPVGQLKQVFSGGDGVIYAIAGNGDLWWYRHDGQYDGSFAWSAGSPQRVGVGWGELRSVFSGGGGVIYGIDEAGDLLWYRHDGRNDGSFAWAANSGAKVGVGWGALHKVFCGDDGVLYAVTADGDLMWYRHDGRNDGSFNWSAGSASKVGVGWGRMATVFSGGDGVLYGIDDTGGLLWYRHDGYANGSFVWAPGSGNQVGAGWGSLRTVFSSGDGVIYGIDDAGDLLWYRHDGHSNGSFVWAAGSPSKVGSGWVVAGRVVIYAIEAVMPATIDLAGHVTPKSGGRLLWYRHDGHADGSFSWAAGSPKQVGTGWGSLRSVFSGGNSVIYGIDEAGDLLWYRHDGRDDGRFAWAKGSPKKVGTGWGSLQQVFSGGEGVLYGITASGDLMWYRHDGQHDGSFTWSANSPQKVGTGWGDLLSVFSGGGGVLYGIAANGDLLWYRHDGRVDGTFAWAEGSSKKVGTGWSGLRQVFSGGDGLLYAITDDGDLQWYRHDGRYDGSFSWAAGSPSKVGVGWGDLPTVFSGN
ncbi:MAG TPA: tachylectin-related carbohydrate-binding protein [Ideonella sp.]|nr:tachylectin-related carbohydrate-binding protein [Ideonella sp.]